MKHWLLILGSLLTTSAFAHPVIFKDGIATTVEIRPQYALLDVNYTLMRNLAVGVTYSRLSIQNSDFDELQTASAQLNWLVYRYNGKESQGNVYLMPGIGYAYFNEDQQSAYALGSAQLDYETRFFYTALKTRVNWTSKLIPYHIQARIGFAPYKAGYNELNTWIVAQVDHAPKVLGNFEFTPLLRFFYRTALWEVGASVEGNFFVKLMSHF